MEAILAPTDCRLRPDIRNMENGNMGTCLLQQVLAHGEVLGGKSMQGTVFSFSFPQQPLLFFILCTEHAFEQCMSGFSQEKLGRADACLDPRAAVLCYDVFACLLAWEELQTFSTCSGVCLERHGEPTCSAALVFVRGNTGPNNEKNHSLCYA